MKIFYLVALLTFATLFSHIFPENNLVNPISKTFLPHGEQVVQKGNFTKIPNVAEYKKGDWNNLLAVLKHMTIKQALQYAKEHLEVDFFFYVKDGELVLEIGDGNYRIFQQGDAVFFKGTPWWGAVEGQADGYVRVP
jgi:hypothetical protein